MSDTDDCGNISTDFFGELSVRFGYRGVVAVVWISKRQIENLIFNKNEPWIPDTHGFYAVYSKVNSHFVFVDDKNPLVLHSPELTGYSALSFPSVKPRQILYDLAGDNQSHNRRHKGSRTGNITPLGAFSCCSRRADAMLTAAYCHVLNRSYGLFFGINILL